MLKFLFQLLVWDILKFSNKIFQYLTTMIEWVKILVPNPVMQQWTRLSNKDTKPTIIDEVFRDRENKEWGDMMLRFTKDVFTI